MLILNFLISTAILISYWMGIDGVSVEEDLTLTNSQKAALDEFKSRMIPLVDKEYKKKDGYLIRWLRARNFNVNGAQAMLQQDMEWRKRERMDTILEEDWSGVQAHVPLDTEGVDREGKPMTLTDTTEVDFRAALLTSGERVHRYYQRLLEDAEVKIRKFQDEGKNVTRFQYIVNLQNFNLVQHGCLQCLTLYSRLAATYVNHYPNLVDNIIHINTPQVFLPVINLVRPILGEYNKIFHAYGTKQEWSSKLFSIADPTELPTGFGGTREYNLGNAI